MFLKRFPTITLAQLRIFKATKTKWMQGNFHLWIKMRTETLKKAWRTLTIESNFTKSNYRKCRTNCLRFNKWVKVKTFSINDFFNSICTTKKNGYKYCKVNWVCKNLITWIRFLCNSNILKAKEESCLEAMKVCFGRRCKKFKYNLRRGTSKQKKRKLLSQSNELTKIFYLTSKLSSKTCFNMDCVVTA